PERSSHRHGTARASVPLHGGTGREELVDGAARAVVEHRDLDASRRRRAAYEAEADGDGLGGSVARSTGRVADEEHEYWVGTWLVGPGAGRRVEITIRNYVAAARGDIDAQIELTGSTAAARRPGDVRLVPLDHERHEFPGHQSAGADHPTDHRRNRYTQRGDRGAGRGAECQQHLTRRVGASGGGGETGRGVVVRQLGVISGGDEVRHALTVDLIDRLLDEARLEERLVEVADVVGDDLGAGGCERQDAVGKIRLTLDRGMERESRARRDVVDHLQHRATLVAVGQELGGGKSAVEIHARVTDRRCLVGLGEHVDRGGQIAAGDVLGGIGREAVGGVAAGAGRWYSAAGLGVDRVAVEAVGQHTHRDAPAVEVLP